MKPIRVLVSLSALLGLLLSLNPAPARAATAAQTPGAPSLQLTQSVSAEPLLGGQVGFTLTLRNLGATPVVDKGYNLTITDTLPLGLSFAAADPPPSLVAPQADGTTQIVWDNLADLEVAEELTLSLTATLSAALTVADTRVNLAGARLNTAPDNSGGWVEATSSLSFKPQAVDIELAALPSSAVAQASGAGELAAAPGARPGADWPYRYQVTLRNNKLGPSTNVVALVTLPPGVAYLGAATISANGGGATAVPTLTLALDGSLELRWGLGALATARYDDPVLISFDAAVPYAFRTAADTAATVGAFAGPMSGAPIAEDLALPASYEARATYSGVATADGTASTPTDDAPTSVRAAYLTLDKRVTPGTVGIGTVISYTLDLYVSEYYTATNVVVTDTLPDGLSYVDDSASLAPSGFALDAPGPGQTTLTWSVPAEQTVPGARYSISFQATVDATYSAPPNAGQPVVSGDRLTNLASVAGDWSDANDTVRLGATTPDEDRAAVGTLMPSFSKAVRDPQSGQWVARAAAFTGDTLRFRLSFSSAATIDAKAIVIRDFLPRGMTYVAGSAAHTSSGSFSDGPGCAAAPSAPSLGTLNGLQFLEWRLCNVARGSSWEVTLDAKLGDIPNVQPGWIVANFGKLSGMNTAAAAYSLRQSATVDYNAPQLQLVKTASPRTNLIGGSVVTYSIRVTNSGKATAYNLVVSDSVPADLLVAASGGSASPRASSYSTTAGSPSTGAGGTLSWSSVASLAPNAVQTFTYQATVPAGLPAGAQMTNLASVAYNSRADNAGHQWAATSVVADPNTDDESVYTKGVTASLAPSPGLATVGEIVTWTVTGSVAPGTIAYWPVVQINSLPDGLVYLPGGDAVVSATLDTAHHTPATLSNGAREVRFFLETLDNTAGATPLIFTVSFRSLVTGYKIGSPATLLWAQCCIGTATANAYVGWYDSTGGYNGQGFAHHGLETNRTTRRSGRATANLGTQVPNLLLGYRADQTQVGADDTVTLTAQVTNVGNSIAHDLVLTDTLPSGVQFIATQSMGVTYPPGFPAQSDVFTDSNLADAQALSYELGTLHVGATWSVTFTAKVDAAIGASLDLTTLARVAAYDTRPGLPPDRNGDSLADQWRFGGPAASVTLATPRASIAKTADVAGELTYGGPITYTLTLPATPIDATIYQAVVSDQLDGRLAIDSVSGGSAVGRNVGASFASIPPGEQRTLVIRGHLPLASSAQDGAIITNTATMSHRDGSVASNTVANTIVAPALAVTAMADRAELQAGVALNLTITLANLGHGLAAEPRLSLTLPANLSYVPGSARLGEADLEDPTGGVWALPELAGASSHTLVFSVIPAVAEAGAAYPVSAAASGRDSLGAAIPPDNRARVPADDDLDDAATVTLYGPLSWSQASSFVVFEDLKKVGWSDWDYNDFITRVDIERGLDGAGNLAALRIHYEALARGAGYDHSFLQRLPLAGGGAARLELRDGAGSPLLTRDQAFGEEDARFTIFERTRNALPPPPGAMHTNTPAAQAVAVPGYQADLTVLLNQAEANPSDALPPLPWDPYILVHNTGQEVHLVGPGRLNNTQQVNAAYDRTSPLVGYDLPLAQAFPTAWRWPIEYIGIWQAYPQFTRFIATAGREQASWYQSGAAVSERIWSGRSAGALLPASTGVIVSRYFSGPVVADLTGDGRPELVTGNLLANRVEVYDTLMRPLAGWPQATGGGVKAAPLVADLNGDGSPEVLAGAEDGRLYAWHASGAAVAGWPVRLGDDQSTDYRVLATPAVGDLDADGRPEVIVPLADGRLYALRADGTPWWGVSLGEERDSFGSQVLNSSPRLADLDGDGRPEIVVGSSDGKLYVFDGDGALRWSYQTGDMILGAPAVADFVAARPGPEVAVASGDGYVYLLGADGGLVWRRVTRWTIRSTPVAADLDGDGQPELIVGADDSRVYAWRGSGTPLAGWPRTTGGPVFAAPAVGDLDGDGDLEVVAGAEDGRVYAWGHDGQALDGWPRDAAAAVKGTPALANLDADPALEVVIADLGGALRSTGTLQTFVPLLQQR